MSTAEAQEGLARWWVRHAIVPLVGILLAAGATYYFTHLDDALPPSGEGYIYYGRDDDGVPSRRGQLRLVDDSLPLVSELQVGDRFRSVREKGFYKEANDDSPPIANLEAGTCFKALGIKHPATYPGGQGAWLNVRVIECPTPPE